MRHFIPLLVLGSALTWTACASDGESRGQGGVGSSGSSMTPDAAYSPSDTEVEDLIFLREEEKLARDVYLTLASTWGLPQHANIAESEQQHTDSVQRYLEAYAIEDPVSDDAVGQFANGDLAELYDELIEAGRASENAALTVGATIEDLDIADLQGMKQHTDDASLLALYDSLECGSRNHLRAYHDALTERGESYTAQYLEANQISAIVASDRERCGR